MNRLLIDSDVALDFFFDRSPFSESAAEIFKRCESGDIKGYFTPLAFSNMYYIMRKTASHQVVLEKIKLLLSITDVLQMTRSIVFQAANSEFKDFEDALQYFSAIHHNGIDIILSRNLKDYAQSKIAVMTPEHYLKTISA